MNEERYIYELSKLSNDELLNELFYNKEQMEKARIGASGNQEKMIILEKKREQYYLCKKYILEQRMKKACK